MPSKDCPVCTVPLTDQGNAGNRDANQFDCPNCGQYEISRSALVNLRRPRRPLTDNSRARAVLSHAIYRMQASTEWPQLNTYTIDKILEGDYLPTPIEQGDNLILWLADHTTPGIKTKPKSTKLLQAKLGSQTPDEVDFIAQSMIEKGYLMGSLYSPGTLCIGLQFDGWQRYQVLKRSTSQSARIFMAMFFGNTSLADIVENHFKPAAEDAGFMLHRLDDNPEAGLIDERMRVEIRRASCLVADLSDQNPGAYWEAGFAEGIGKPVIYTCEKNVFDKKKTHFDTNHHHTIMWDAASPENAANQLKATLRATLPDLAKMDDD